MAATWRCRQRGGPDLGEGTVFIVDDDPEMRCALLSLLSISGYHARAFASTQEFFARVAADLGTVEKTIRVHRGRILRKMGVRSVVELVQLAHRTQFLESLSPGLSQAGIPGMRAHANGSSNHSGDAGDR